MGIRKAVKDLVADLSSTSVADIERELTKLEQRRAQLTDALETATQSAIDASATRRDLIIANREQEAIEDASVKVREAEDRRVALDDALRALEQKVAGKTKRLEEAKDQAERDRVAQMLEHEADTVEKESAAVDKAAKQFASAYKQLRSAMSPASYLRMPERKQLAEDRVAGLLAAEALAGAMPELFVHKHEDLGVASVLARGFSLGHGVVRFETRDQQQLAEPSCAREHAERLITTPLRAKAAAIRSGEEPAALPSALPQPAYDVERPPATCHILFLEPVRYTGRGGQPVVHAAWTARVPVLVAEAAIKRGLALDPDTDEAREKMRKMAERRQRGRLAPAVILEEAIDLGVNLTEDLEPSESAA